MKKLLIILPILFIYGCASNPVEPTIIYKDVLIPVPTKCKVEIPNKYSYISDSIDTNASIFDKMKSLLIDKENSKSKEEELRTLLSVCIK